MNDDPSLRRQIVICCDGTNNTLTGGSEDTNVVMLHNYLDSQPDKPGHQRVLYYDPGVGSPGLLPPVGPIDWLGRTWKRVSGLASGGGSFDNIAEAYIFLMRNWRGAQDDIYCFGFSRGAFTVRAVAGMVNLFGVVRPEYEALVPTLVHLYFAPSSKAPASAVTTATRKVHQALSRKHAAAAEPGGHAPVAAADSRALLAQEVVRNFAGLGRGDAWVHWIGVWDTVESVGLPGPLSRVNPSPPTFSDKRFRHARHALSLDEHRWPFLPRLYEEPDDVVNSGRSLRQRWFPGVHCDAGGSYPPGESGISLAAFDWMVGEVATELGVAPTHRAQDEPSAQAWRHDPLWEMSYWALAGMTVRDMRPLLQRKNGPAVPFEPVAGQPLASDSSIRSTWERRRKVWPVFMALLIGVLCLFVSGLCVLPAKRPAWNDTALFTQAASAAFDLAVSQLDAVRFDGLFAAGHRPWETPLDGRQPGWAMFWDLGWIACWGYLVARIASRAFAWMAGERDLRSARPWWLPLGFAPMAAVTGDLIEDVSLWLAMFSHWAGTDIVALAVLWVGGVAALVKCLGLIGCASLLAVRVWLELVRRPGRREPVVSG